MDSENRYNGDLSGPYLRYDYPPVGVTKTITDGNGQVLAEYDGDGNLKYNYLCLSAEVEAQEGLFVEALACLPKPCA